MIYYDKNSKVPVAEKPDFYPGAGTALVDHERAVIEYTGSHGAADGRVRPKKNNRRGGVAPCHCSV